MTEMLVSMVSHDCKSHLSPHFDHCDIRNEVVLLITQLAFQRYAYIYKDMSSLCVDTSRHLSRYSDTSGHVYTHINIVLMHVNIVRT